MEQHNKKNNKNFQEAEKVAFVYLLEAKEPANQLPLYLGKLYEDFTDNQISRVAEDAKKKYDNHLVHQSRWQNAVTAVTLWFKDKPLAWGLPVDLAAKIKKDLVPECSEAMIVKAVDTFLSDHAEKRKPVIFQACVEAAEKYLQANEDDRRIHRLSPPNLANRINEEQDGSELPPRMLAKAVANVRADREKKQAEWANAEKQRALTLIEQQRPSSFNKNRRVVTFSPRAKELKTRTPIRSLDQIPACA